MNLQTIRSQLKTLKLHSAAGEIEEVLSRHKRAVEFSWVSELLEREIDARKQRAIQGRIKRAAFAEVTSLESFDWKFNPKIDQDKIRELASLNFIGDHRIALFLGPAGVGKTHLALAIGVLAAKEGYRVYSATTKRLIEQMHLAKIRNQLDVLFKKMLSCKLWIIDDWGVISMSREIAEEVFDLLDRRKYSSAMVLTSNREIEEWAEVFPDPVLANATIDRIFDRAMIVPFQGQSYRLKGKISLLSSTEVNTPKRRVSSKRGDS